jgi:uncharacterized membrane protein YfcA
MTDTPLYVGVGFLVGSLVGLTGVGGGSMMTPLLMMFFGQSPAVAVGTDLLFSATTKLVATAAFGFSKRVDWPIVGRLLMGSIPGAAGVVLSLWLTHRTPGAADAITRHGIAIVLALAALGLVLKTPIQHLGLKVTARALAHVERHKVLVTALAGLALGVAVSLTSVGAGALGVVILLALYPLRLTSDRLVATDIAHALPITLIAGAGHAYLGHVNLDILAALILGSIPGVLIASRITIRLPDRITHTLIALMLGSVSGRMLFS